MFSKVGQAPPNREDPQVKIWKRGPDMGLAPGNLST